MAESRFQEEAHSEQGGFLTGLKGALKSFRQEKRGNRLGYLFVAPAILLFLVFQGYPILRGLLMAFSDYRWLVLETQGLFDLNGLDNYVALFQDETFFRSLGITLKYTALFLPLLLALSLGTALLIAQVRHPRLAAFYRVIAYIPVVLPVSVSMMMWRQVYNPQYGILNALLSDVLHVQKPPLWLTDPAWSMTAVLIPDLWLGFGYFTLLFLIGLYNIDPTLYEAAAIDGANGWQQLLHITLPLLKPIITLVLITTGGLASAVVPILTLFQTPAGPNQSMLTLGVYSFRIAFSIGDMRMGYAASMALVTGLYSMIFTALVFRILRTERS
ncbi:MAG: sugar ABC transporter permease [Anaerolineae bacterium]|nr:sugar ABC transporter permease [Anaerolineae bacterium]